MCRLMFTSWSWFKTLVVLWTSLSGGSWLAPHSPDTYHLSLCLNAYYDYHSCLMHMHGSICQQDAPACLTGMSVLSVHISIRHAHGWLISCTKPMNKIIFTSRQVFLRICVWYSAYLTWLHVCAYVCFVTIHKLYKLSLQPTVQAFVTEEYSRAPPEWSICTTNKTLAVREEKCCHQHDLCCFNITRAWLPVSDLFYVTDLSKKPHCLPLFPSLTSPYTTFCCALQPICAMLLQGTCICARLLQGTFICCRLWVDWCPRSVLAIATHLSPFCFDHQRCAVMDEVSSSASSCSIFSLDAANIHCWGLFAGHAMSVLCYLECDTICHIEIGLMSLSCEHINQHQAFIVAGTMRSAVRSTGQSGPCCHQTSAVKSHLLRMQTLCWILRI